MCALCVCRYPTEAREGVRACGSKVACTLPTWVLGNEYGSSGKTTSTLSHLSILAPITLSTTVGLLLISNLHRWVKILRNVKEQFYYFSKIPYASCPWGLSLLCLFSMFLNCF